MDHGFGHSARTQCECCSELFSFLTHPSIYGYPTNNLTSEARIQLKDDELTCASFWVRMALSPDSRYLTCGSKSGTIFTWDISNSKRAQQSQDRAVKLFHSKGTNGTSNEVGSVDWADDVVSIHTFNYSILTSFSWLVARMICRCGSGDHSLSYLAIIIILIMQCLYIYIIHFNRCTSHQKVTFTVKHAVFLVCNYPPCE